MTKEHVDDPEIDEHDDELILDEPLPEDEEADAPEVNDEFVVSFGDEEADPEENDPEFAKKMRGIAREALGRAKTAEARIAELTKPAPVQLGPKPTLESCEYDDQRFDREYDAWKAAEQQQKDAESQAKQARESDEKRSREIIGRYEERKARLPQAVTSRFEGAQDAVIDAIGRERFGYIVAGAEEPEKLVWALAQHPKRLEALAAIDIPAKFAFQAARMEKEMKVGTKKPPAPEGVERGSGTMSIGTDKVEQRLAEKAAMSGDRSALIKYRAEKKERARG